MVIGMEINTGESLDEACNRNNEAYGDEALYAAWTASSRVDTRHESAEPSSEFGTRPA